MAKNVYSLQLLRNGNIFANYEAAVNAITSSTVQDGVIKLARYAGNSTDSANTKYNSSTVKTIFGIYAAMEGYSGWTVFDSYTEIIQNLQEQIDAMGGESGSIHEQIMAEIEKLDYSGVTTGNGVVVTNVTEQDGNVSATAANVGTLELTGYAKGSDSGAVASTDSINAAISKLEKQIDAANDAKNDAIADLDYTDTAQTGYYVSKVDEADGVISVTREALPTVAAISEAGKPITAVSESLGEISATAGTINAEYVTVADADNNFTASTVEAVLAEIKSGYTAADAALKDEILGGASASADTLGELETLINNLSAGAATYTIRKDTASLPAEIKERYTLVETINGVSTDKQDVIDIPKDSHIVSINYIESGEHAQNLEYVYIDASGNTQTTYVDMAHLILESEFASGVTSTSGIAHGVVDPTSETFLTVGADGFKLAGVQAAIDAASGDVKSKLDELSGKTVTGIDMTGGTANIAAGDNGTKKITINTDGSQIHATGYAKGSDASAIAATDSINAALAKLENQVDAAKAAATTKVVEGTDAGNNLEIVPTTSSTDSSVTYTINLTDVASASALTAETAARKAVDGQNGDTYAANTSANYISAATSLNDADVKLDAALKAVEDAAGNVQDEVDAIEQAIGLTTGGTYTANTTNNYTSGATSVNGAIDALDDAVKANEDDIAELSGKSVTSVTVNGVEVVSNNAAPIVLEYENEAANSTDGMVIDTDSTTGAMTIQFGTLDCGEYN